MDISDKRVNKTNDAINLRLLECIADLDGEFGTNPLAGPLLAANLVRLGASMYFYCSEDKTIAASEVLIATNRGIEDSRTAEEAI